MISIYIHADVHTFKKEYVFCLLVNIFIRIKNIITVNHYFYEMSLLKNVQD